MATESIAVERTTWTVPNWLRGLLVVGLVVSALGLLVLGWTQTRSALVVEMDGQRHEVRTHATTVEKALRRAGFDLYPEDKVSPGREAPLQPGMVVEVERAQPVTLKADGQNHRVRSHAATVGELLAEEGVAVGPADELWLGEQVVTADTPLSSRDGDRAVVSLHRAATLSLVDDGVTTTLHTTLDTVGQVFEAHGINLFVGDEVTPNLQNRIMSGMTVTIERSVPVRIEVDGRTIHTRTRARTVAGVLGQEGVALVGQDRVIPPQEISVVPDLLIRVTRVRQEYEVEFDAIPFQMIWVPDPEVEIDNVRLVQDGQIGLTKRRYRVVYENGEEVERSLEDIWAAQSPITKTMAYGTKIVVRTLETPDGPVEYWRKMRVYVTSYMPRSCGKPPDHPRYGYTRLGVKLRRGIVATDPSVIPLRSWMYVPGYGKAIAADTGGGVKGKFVDLGFTDDDYESWHWWMDIYLLTPVPPSYQIRYVLPKWPRFPDYGRWSR